MQQSLELLSQTSIDLLKGKKNLLAFSGGVDSTALFFLLREAGVEFDLAIVDYGIREQSKDEVEYAKELAKRYNKSIYLKNISLDRSNFEKRARDARYSFFEETIKKESYQNLITAHQLNDKLEWFLMQLSKGAGLVEILGFDEISKRDRYKIIRPLIKSTKEELIWYLDRSNEKYFIDKSNLDISFKRNLFRSKFANELLREYKDGIKMSFEYLHRDKESLLIDRSIQKIKELYIIRRNKNEIRDIDLCLKEMGYLLSSKQKEEIQRCDELVISDRFAISKSNNLIFISPYSKDIMPKGFKERCRALKIPKKIRAYLFESKINLDYLDSSFLSSKL